MLECCSLGDGKQVTLNHRDAPPSSSNLATVTFVVVRLQVHLNAIPYYVIDVRSTEEAAAAPLAPWVTPAVSIPGTERSWRPMLDCCSIEAAELASLRRLYNQYFWALEDNKSTNELVAGYAMQQSCASLPRVEPKTMPLGPLGLLQLVLHV